MPKPHLEWLSAQKQVWFMTSFVFISIYVRTIVYDFFGRLIVTLQVEHQKQLHAKSLKQEVSPIVVKDIECCEFRFLQTVIVSLMVNGDTIIFSIIYI